MHEVPTGMVTPQRLGRDFLLAAEQFVAAGQIKAQFRFNRLMKGQNILHLIELALEELEAQGKARPEKSGQLSLNLEQRGFSL